MPKMPKSKVKLGRLMQIPVDSVIANRENPRMLFDEEPLKILEESIKDVGVLSPLLVYQRKRDGQLVILDGERRLICAKRLGIKKLPANVIEEPTAIENIIRMFNIHNVREPWELMPTALKLEVIMREKKVKNDKELSAITSLSIPTIQRCRTLLSFPKKYQDLMLVLNPKDRLKTDFFTELYLVLNLIEKNLPGVSSKFNRNQITDIFLEKYANKSFTNVVHFRKIANLIRSIKKNEATTTEVERIITTLLSDKNTKIDEVISSSAEISKRLGLKRSLDSAYKKIEKYDVASVGNNQNIFESLVKLRNLIDIKLKQFEKQKKE